MFRKWQLWAKMSNATQQVSQNLQTLATGESTSRGARDAQKASIQLVEMSAQLQKLVQQFKVSGYGENGRRVSAHVQPNRTVDVNQNHSSL